MECFNRQRRGDRVYRAPQWRPGRDARHNQLCGYGLSAATTYSYTVAARDAAGNISTQFDERERHDSTPPPSNSASLMWDAVTAPTLSGTAFYFGTAPGTYLQSLGQGISVGNVTAYTLTGLASGSQYYFA